METLQSKWFWVSNDPDAELWNFARIGSVVVFKHKRLGRYISVQIMMFIIDNLGAGFGWRVRFWHGWFWLWS